MAFIEFKVNMTRTAIALERIADCLERLSPVPAVLRKPKPAVFINVDPAAIAEAEEEAERKREVEAEGSGL